jgi:hypothetical protein
MAVRGTTARIYPASCLEGRCPLRHDGICALPPQHFDDLTMVFVITRLRKSRSDVSRHQDITSYATVWKGLCAVNTCAMHLLRCSLPSPRVPMCPCGALEPLKGAGSASIPEGADQPVPDEHVSNPGATDAIRPLGDTAPPSRVRPRRRAPFYWPGPPPPDFFPAGR